MNKFKVGDRVRAYGNYPSGYDYGCKSFLRGNKATVESIANDNEIFIRLDDPTFPVAEVHPNQCRLLRPKKRRVWVDPQGLDRKNEHLVASSCHMSCENGDWVEFVEVIRK